MKPIFLDFPIPITMPRLMLRPPQIGEGVMVNADIMESFDALYEFMPWAKTKPTVDDTEKFIRQAAANWISIKN
jgi:ribosomal-protein-serine acetyltransferase